MNTMENIWDAIIENLKSSLAQETFDLWIKPIKPLSMSDNKFIIEVPNKFFVDWVNQHQKDNIENIIKEKCDNKRYSLEFQCNQDIDTILKAAQTDQLPAEPIEDAAEIVSDEFNSRYTFDSFVVGDSNKFAHAVCFAAANNPGKEYNPVFIYGGVGLGKTHLLHAIGNRILKNNPTLKVIYTSSEKFINEFIDSLKNDTQKMFRNKYRGLDCLLIDDIQFLINKERSQEEFFYTFNALYETKKQIILTSDRPPKELANIEDRLISRFEWGVVADIKPPDYETRMAILRKKSETERVYVPNDVISFLAERIKTNIRELEGSLIRIVAFSSLTGTPLTVDVAKEILNDIIRREESSKPITIDIIQKVVAKHYHIDIRDMKSKKRTDTVALPRQIAMYIARTLTEMSTIEIGEEFGGKDHTTVLHACDKIKTKLNNDPFYTAEINKIIQKIKSNDEE
jgi:chromosomal replication initiator protein